MAQNLEDLDSIRFGIDWEHNPGQNPYFSWEYSINRRFRSYYLNCRLKKNMGMFKSGDNIKLIAQFIRQFILFSEIVAPVYLNSISDLPKNTDYIISVLTYLKIDPGPIFVIFQTLNFNNYKNLQKITDGEILELIDSEIKDNKLKEKAIMDYVLMYEKNISKSGDKIVGNMPVYENIDHELIRIQDYDKRISELQELRNLINFKFNRNFPDILKVYFKKIFKKTGIKVDIPKELTLENIVDKLSLALGIFKIIK